MTAGEFGRGWPLVLAAFLGVAFSLPILGAGYSLGVFVAALEAEFGWTRGQIMTVPLILSAIAVPLGFAIGRIADKRGVRRLVIVSQAAFGLSFAALGLFTRDLPSFYALYAAMAVAGAGTLSVSFTKAIARRFERRRGLAIGLALAGSGLCALAVPAYATAVLEAYGWRAAYVALGALPLFVALPASWLLLRDPAPDPVAGRTSGTAGIPVREAWASRRFWTLNLAFLLASAAVTGFISATVPLLRDSGMGADEAARTAGLFGLTVVGGRVAVGWLVDRVWGPAVAAGFLLPAALGCAALAGGGAAAWLPVAAIVLVGLATGAEYDLAAYLASRYFGVRDFGQIYAAQSATIALGGGAAPALYGFAFDRAGSYEPALIGSAAALATCAALLLTLGRYPSFDDRTGPEPAVDG